MRVGLVLVLTLTGLCGCGASARPDALGTAAGQAFVASYDKTPVKAAPILAEDFTLWVTGKLKNDPTAGNPPGSPLSVSERRAAASVVIRYADRLVSKGELPATLPNGANLVAYLRAHGVG